jgi:CheY-like chemotaxis protein
MIRVLLADDQALVRGGFRMILEAQPDIEVVAEADNGVHAVQMCRATTPDVVLMDIRMPTMNGIEATAELARQGLATRVLILTTFDLDEYVYEAVWAGASGPAGCPTPRSPGPCTSARRRSRRTMTRILAKLGLRDRAQAVVAAYESGLIQPPAPRRRRSRRARVKEGMTSKATSFRAKRHARGCTHMPGTRDEGIDAHEHPGIVYRGRVGARRGALAGRRRVLVEEMRSSRRTSLPAGVRRCRARRGARRTPRWC